MQIRSYKLPNEMPVIRKMHAEPHNLSGVRNSPEKISRIAKAMTVTSIGNNRP
jgi:hypothetical protein